MVLARFKACALSEKQGERSERKTNNPTGSIHLFPQLIANNKTEPRALESNEGGVHDQPVLLQTIGEELQDEKNQDCVRQSWLKLLQFHEPAYPRWKLLNLPSEFCQPRYLHQPGC